MRRVSSFFVSLNIPEVSTSIVMPFFAAVGTTEERTERTFSSLSALSPVAKRRRYEILIEEARKMYSSIFEAVSSTSSQEMSTPVSAQTREMPLSKSVLSVEAELYL